MIKWNKYRLDEICHLVTDGTHDSPKNLVKGFPFIKGTQIKEGTINFSNCDYVSEEDHLKIIKRSKPEKGDILFSNIGMNLGETAIIKVDFSFSIKNVALFKPNNTLVDNRFLYYLLTSPKEQLLLKNKRNGSAQPFLDLKTLRGHFLLIPNINTQIKIAAILSKYDDLIENNNQRIKLLDEMSEEIYKEWFVRLRFPGHENLDSAKFKKIKLRECLFHYIGGGWGEEVPKGKHTEPAHVIRGTDFPGFNNGKLNFDVLRYHTASNLSSRICEANDIIFEVSGGTESQSLGRTCFISEIAINRFDAPVICASFCKLLRINSKKVSPYYINELLNRMHSTGELKVYQVQSTGISNYQFEDFIEATKVFIPPIEVQEKFDNIIGPMYDEIQILGAKNQVLQETRDLLLPRLISGKLSVENLEIEELNMVAESTLT
ncbi:MAG: restriction endonuclease subunit S [Maribacter sp.]